jgi:hypothetical protein
LAKKDILKYVFLITGAPLTGVDVMITIFCDFRQFLAKKLAFFSKTNVMIKILHNFIFVSSRKRQFFAEFFGELKLELS